MTWFSNSVAERRFDDLVSKMVEAVSNRKSDPLLIQHLADCVRRQDKIEATLKHQDETATTMHRENSNKLQTLMRLVFAALLGLVGTLIMQVVNSHPAPIVMEQRHK